MSHHKSIRTLIADDHPIVLDGIALLLRQAEDIEPVAQARNGREAVEAYFVSRPDVAVLDVIMPGMGGIEAAAAILARDAGARLILLSDHEGGEIAVRALKAGVAGYVLKSAPSDDLAAAIRSVHAGNAVVASAVVAQVGARASDDELSGREMEVLGLMCRGFTNPEISEALFISQSTVKSHVGNVIGKLRSGDRTKAVTEAYRLGIAAIAAPDAYLGGTSDH